MKFAYTGLIIVGVASFSFGLNETGETQPVNIKSGEQISFWKVLVGGSPVALMSWAPNAGYRKCVNYSGPEVWIGSSTAVSPHSNSWPIFIKESYGTHNSAPLYAVTTGNTSTLHCYEEK